MSNAVEHTSIEVARARADRIRAGLESLYTLRFDIAEAYQAQDWQSLGYDSWSSYVESEFVGARLRLPREERRELVGTLREAGMSTRAIAATAGTSKGTIDNDINEIKAGGQNWPRGGDDDGLADQTPVTGLDGKTYSAGKPPITDLISGDDVAELNGQSREDEPIDAEVVDNAPAATEGTAVTPEPMEPKKPKPRKPITDQARKEAFDGRKWADRIRGLMRDDRRARNAEELCTALQGDLMHVRDVVNEALETLDHTPERQ